MSLNKSHIESVVLREIPRYSVSHRSGAGLLRRLATLTVLAVVAFALCPALSARDFNDKLLNRPYADNRSWHLGFSFGTYVSNLSFAHNGLITDDGKQYRVDQPDYQPGFCVNGLFALRLNNYFSLRFSPGMYFGSRDITILDYNNPDVDDPQREQRQNVKSALVTLPFDVKFAALRYRNIRPYVTAGVMPVIDVGKQRNDFLKFSKADCFITVGFGCDFYLPYFKLIPELKFCFGLKDILQHDRKDLADEPEKFAVTRSLDKATSRMVVLTFYFE